MCQFGTFGFVDAINGKTRAARIVATRKRPSARPGFRPCWPGRARLKELQDADHDASMSDDYYATSARRRELRQEIADARAEVIRLERELGEDQ